MKEPRYTAEAYRVLEDQPLWMADGFDSQQAYESYYARTIGSWRKQYDDRYKNTVNQWQDAIAYVENIPTGSYDVFSPESQIAQMRIPYALCAILEVIALLFTNYPQPIFVSPGKPQDQYAMALQALCKIILKQNCFNVQNFDMGLDIGFASLGVLKTYVDYDEQGPFGEPGKIVITKIDPAKVAFDPQAKRLRWDDMGYCMYTDYLDLGVARRMFPNGSAKLQSMFQTEQDNNLDDSLFGNNLKSPVPNPMEGQPSNRNKVKVVECWFKDDRTKFVADTETVINRPFKIDDEGNKISNPDFDADKPEIYTRPVVGDDGYVKGSFQPAYPHGRCVVLAQDKRVILDFANPFWHHKAPFVFFRGRPARSLVTTGDLTNIVTIDKKINDILNRIHVMAQAEIERPMLAEVNTFKTPRSWFRMSGMASSVIVKNPGREFGRLPPTEIPGFVFTYLQYLFQAMDKVMAVAGVMRGDLQEGAQLSAETVSSLQGMATTMLKMKGEMISEGMKELGYQVGWLCRQTFPENITIPVQKPDGTMVNVDWNEENAADDYTVEIESGSGVLGSQSATPDQVIPLFTNGLIDRLKGLLLMGYHDAADINQRMEADRMEKIVSASTGQSLGVSIKKFEKSNEAELEGRKPKI